MAFASLGQLLLTAIAESAYQVLNVESLPVALDILAEFGILAFITS